MAASKETVPLVEMVLSVLNKTSETTGLDHTTLGAMVFATLIFLLLTVRLAMKSFNKIGAPPSPSSSSSKRRKEEISTNKVLPRSGVNAAVPNRTDSPVVSNTIPITTVTPQAVSPSVTPRTPSPAKEPVSPQVLHSGPLRKRSMLSAPVNSFELYQEDERNIAIFYTTSTANGSTPRNAKQKSSMYLGPDSFIEISNRTRFIVHQLKAGGKKLSLEATSTEERDKWVTKIQEAIDALKPQQKA